jgi:hypothetical protein
MREKVNGAWKMKNATIMLCYVTNESICVIIKEHRGGRIGIIEERICIVQYTITLITQH